jgi:periplasmic divalent cation tolerance protein
MTDVLVVFCTCSDDSEAERIASAIVEEQLAACVNLLPAISSIYRWKGKMERSREVLMIIKTASSRFEALCERVVALHSYETPEIIALPVMAGLEKYLDWVRTEAKAP